MSMGQDVEEYRNALPLYWPMASQRRVSNECACREPVPQRVPDNFIHRSISSSLAHLALRVPETDAVTDAFGVPDDIATLLVDALDANQRELAKVIEDHVGKLDCAEDILGGGHCALRVVQMPEIGAELGVYS